ncbi:FAD-dependent oxidoreductase [Acidianus sulfidivorans JP7]|uniref:Dihydrolipoamide dehydrogenase n=1 Tax=Acidianus sulfidivorans JP7 TaxID=619593 RepID=A0A2U9INJ3_9CREN|nr:NAD(P)/FAD-dependent oxidoreductase [Acidianus sulfidivorans]AWR97566.1 FAD-dependent oxidoreductase [Acidianus sulfidivorans JP7]
MDFDVIVLGGGVGGYSAALRSAELGKKVAIVEKDQIGGECINRACIPSKTLIDAVKIINKARKSSWISGNVSLDYDKLNQYKNNIIENIRNTMIKNLEKYSIKIINGTGKINDNGEVVVGDKTLTYDNLVISTGSVPISLPDFPLNFKNVVDPWTAMNLPEVPNNIVIVGGGVAGVELATLFRAMNKDVKIIELMPQLLPGFDKDLASETKKRLEEKGVEIFLNAKSKIVNTQDKVKFSVNLPNQSEEISTDLAVITIGRKASTEGLNLQSIKVETDKRGYIKVDETARTTNSKVYATGDVAGMPLSATKAWKQGIVAGDNIGNKNSKMPKYSPISIFADLEIGSIGKTIDDIKKEDPNAREIIVQMRDIPRSWTVNETEGFLKLVISNNKIVGAHMIGEGATEIINTLSLAMENDISVDKIYNTLFSHPTLTEIISEAVQRLTNGEIY